jgi:hypothetical protein
MKDEGWSNRETGLDPVNNKQLSVINITKNRQFPASLFAEYPSITRIQAERDQPMTTSGTHPPQGESVLDCFFILPLRTKGKPRSTTLNDQHLSASAPLQEIHFLLI